MFFWFNDFVGYEWVRVIVNEESRGFRWDKEIGIERNWFNNLYEIVFFFLNRLEEGKGGWGWFESIWVVIVII